MAPLEFAQVINYDAFDVSLDGGKLLDPLQQTPVGKRGQVFVIGASRDVLFTDQV